MSTQFVCLSGLPRSGSTTLSAILSQNPAIHAEGNSAVCQLIWDMNLSCTHNVTEQLQANNREYTIRDLIVQVPNTYYRNAPRGTKVILDKCRAWTLPANVALLRKYIDPNIKIIVLERPITDVFKSFAKLYKHNQWSETVSHECLNDMLKHDTEPIMRPLKGISEAKASNSANTFLFIQYDDLVTDPQATLDRIYKFCGWAPFQHTFQGIVNKHPENDESYKLKGFHDIRSKLEKKENTIVLPPDILEKCQQVDKFLGYL
jgi:sulfotransferase